MGQEGTERDGNRKEGRGERKGIGMRQRKKKRARIEHGTGRDDRDSDRQEERKKRKGIGVEQMKRDGARTEGTVIDRHEGNGRQQSNRK